MKTNLSECGKYGEQPTRVMSYSTTRDHLLDELDRVGVLLDGLAASDADGAGASPPPDGQTADDAGGPKSLGLAIPDPYHERATTHAEELRERCAATSDDVTLRLDIVGDRFDLTRRHLDVLVLALAPAVDERYKRKYQVVDEGERTGRPTVALLTDLFAQTDEAALAATELVGENSPLRRHGLVTLSEPDHPESTELDQEIVVTEHVCDYLQGHDGLDPALQEIAALEPAERTLSDLRLDDPVRERIETLADREGEAGQYYFHGPAGSGTHRAAEALADQELLRADLGAVLAADALERLHREALLQDRPVHLTNADAAGDGESPVELEAVIERFADLSMALYITGTDAWTPTGTTLDIDAIVEFPRPSVDLRRAFWRDHEAELPDDLDPELLAATFELTQGQLEAALATARSLADGDPSAEDIRAGCRAQSADGLDELSQHIDPASSWDDIHLRAEAERELELVREHIAQRARVYSEWGFDEQFSRGTGVVALFKGKSGTGKTMAAEVLANDVGMDLYKIDLSSVISKYIGETEENLERIFEAAEQSNAILLFDEADSIFGDRAEVSDATDRYANVEVNYLLQRIESYDGVVLLTTNYSTNIDDAFSRRIDHTIRFEKPQEDTRDAIWRGIFPDAAPTEDIEYDLLAELELTGGQIKSVSQTTAVLAAADGGTIGMEHVVRALEREFDTRGPPLSGVDFGEYARHFQSQHGRAALGSESDTDESNRGTASTQSPEEIVEQFVELLDDGDGKRAHELYHSDALLDELGYKERQAIAQGDLSVAGDVERVREDGDKVVVRFDWQLNGRTTTKAYDLRTDGEADGGWRIFNNRERLTTRR